MANRPLHQQAIIETAVKLFRQQGYANTGLNQILEISGAPKGSLYHYFPNGKEALGEAAVVHAGKVVLKTLDELKVKYPTSKGVITAYFELLADWLEQSDYRSGCPIATTLLETTPQSETIRQAGLGVMNSWIASLGEIWIRESLSAAEANKKALLAVTAIEGALIISRVQKSKKPLLQIASELCR